MPITVLPSTWQQATPETPRPGLVAVYVSSPSGAIRRAYVDAFQYEVSRYVNKVGGWSVQLPAASLDLHVYTADEQITTGWKVSILHEGNTPFGAPDRYLLYQGVVERREFTMEAGGAVLNLSGSFHEADLVRRQIRGPIHYDDAPAATIVDAVAGYHIPMPSRVAAGITGDFNEGSAYAVLLKVGDMARVHLRENWDQDSLEFTSVDYAPDSGWVFAQIEQAGPEISEA